MNPQTEVQRYARFFETLRPGIPKRDYEAHFEPDVYFEDPFHRFNALDDLIALFERMFDTLEAPAFTVKEIVGGGHVAYLRWEFTYRHTPKTPTHSFEGVSRVEFAPSGRVSSHIDYWDAAHNLYERLPIIGKLFSYLRRRVASA